MTALAFLLYGNFSDSNCAGAAGGSQTSLRGKAPNIIFLFSDNVQLLQKRKISGIFAECTESGKKFRCF